MSERKVQCGYCGRTFSARGITRHRNAAHADAFAADVERVGARVRAGRQHRRTPRVVTLSVRVDGPWDEVPAGAAERELLCALQAVGSVAVGDALFGIGGGHAESIETRRLELLERSGCDTPRRCRSPGAPRVTTGRYRASTRVITTV